ncbi:DUF3991 domain-containing protein [Clostridium neuense]|uniref:DUF3991 domain-containing protein n=1 Tax=Clostridium neuense TaxID=1728934 RepID=A0ABW8TFD6_9CLOT
MALISKDKINEARSIDFKEFLEREEGFNFIKEGTNYYRCREHSSLILKYKNGILTYCWTSMLQKGDIIQYVKENITNNNFRRAVEYLLNGYFKEANSTEYKPKIIKGEKSNIEICYACNMKRAYAYLCKTRGINPSIVNELIRKKLISQDNRNNLIFKYLDEKGTVVGAELVGTNTFRRFKSVEKNSDENYGFSLNNGDRIEKLIVFEASIDLLSFLQINYESIQESLLLGLGGAEKIKKIDTYIKQYKDIREIIICTDNDSAGDKAFHKIKMIYSNNYNIVDGRSSLKTTNTKDFNELLLQKAILA